MLHKLPPKIHRDVDEARPPARFQRGVRPKRGGGYIVSVGYIVRGGYIGGPLAALAPETAGWSRPRVGGYIGDVDVV